MPANNIGHVVSELMSLFAARRFGDMEVRARSMLAQHAGTALLHELLGIALAAQGRHAEALAPLQTAAAQDPNDAQFWENLALCQRQLGQPADAAASLRTALAIRPDAVETLKALASVLRQQQRPDEAESILRRALALKPNDTAAHFNLGNVLVDQGSFAMAEESFRRAIALDQAEVAVHANLGNVLVENGRYAEAIECARTVVDLVGDMSGALHEMQKDALDAAASVLSRAGQYGAAAKIYASTAGYRKSASRVMTAISAARRACDWKLAESIESVWKDQRPPGDAGSPYPLLMMATASPADQLAGARAHAQQFDAVARLPPGGSHRHSDTKRLRIGYLSNDFFDHATAHLIAGIIEAHDRDHFEIFAYDYTPPKQDEYRQRIEKAFDRVISIHHHSFREAAQRIAQDHCHIVIDLKGWTAGTRSPILAPRPAPVQMQWLGYPGTMGASWIDYVIADKTLIGAGEEANFSEKVVRLPGSYQPADDKRLIETPRDDRDYGLPENAFVFCSFNQPFKITAEIFDVWMSLLEGVEGSVLWLLQLSPDATDALTREAVARGISPTRIIFAPFVPSNVHLARLSRAHLALDCFPYGSHTTANDALWAGVPLVALAGATFASRVSASILRAAGLPDLVTASVEEYSRVASRFAKDREELARLRSRVDTCRQRSEFFDTKRFTSRLEAAYKAAWQRHQRGMLPDHITID